MPTHRNLMKSAMAAPFIKPNLYSPFAQAMAKASDDVIYHFDHVAKLVSAEHVDSQRVLGGVWTVA